MRDAKILYGTDWHLDRLTIDQGEDFVLSHQYIVDEYDYMVLGGDFANGHTLRRVLSWLGQLDIEVVFVTGNHEHYYTSLSDTRMAIRDFSGKESNLHYMEDIPLIILPNGTYMVGANGWGDGVYGTWIGRLVNDFTKIHDFQGGGRDQSLSLKLGQDSAKNLAHKLSLAKRGGARHILIITHVPPFASVCMYEGRKTEDRYLPHFSCGSTGSVIRQFAETNPDIDIDVYAGHTHHHAYQHILSNLHVTVWGAEYGKPKIHSIELPFIR